MGEQAETSLQSESTRTAPVDYFREGLTRRSFVIALGTGCAAAIFGYFVYPTSKPSTGSSADGMAISPVRPRLKEGVVFRREDSLTDVSLGDRQEAIHCAVNDVGLEVLKLLDGRHLVEDVSRLLTSRYELQSSESMPSKIAHFVAQLGLLGFLAEPFYTVIYDSAEG